MKLIDKKYILICILLLICILGSSILKIETLKNEYDEFKPDRLSKYNNSDNLSIKMLNKLMKTKNMKKNCDELYRKCGKNLESCNKNNLGMLLDCTQDGYEQTIEKIKKGEMMYSKYLLNSTEIKDIHNKSFKDGDKYYFIKNTSES